MLCLEATAYRARAGEVASVRRGMRSCRDLTKASSRALEGWQESESTVQAARSNNRGSTGYAWPIRQPFNDKGAEPRLLLENGDWMGQGNVIS